MKKRIAIVDDERDILDILEKFLSRRDKLDIEVFQNPLTAIESIKSGHFDLVLLDIMMPQINGIDFLRDVKKSSPSTKVIMMTAYSTQDKMLNSKDIGADDYLTKPFISLRDVENKVFDNLGL
ncbi:MAG: response regulator [Campylobacterota bacterium]|nr:response regulator [Campylobacterota bacterium]